MVEDLGPTNGTFVNGERIERRTPLGEGDEVKIGSIVLVLRAPASATRLVDTPVVDPPSGATRLRETTSLRPSGDAEPPTAEQVPAPEPPAPAPEPPAPAPEPPAPAPEPPAPTPEPKPAARADRRGDVPIPDFQPSAIRRVVPGRTW